MPPQLSVRGRILWQALTITSESILVLREIRMQKLNLTMTKIVFYSLTNEHINLYEFSKGPFW